MTPDDAAAIAEIQQKIYRYGFCIDARDFDALDDVFTGDAIVHYDLPGGTKKPWPEMKTWLPGGLQLFRMTQHNMSNPMVELAGDSARSRTYGHLIHLQELTDGTRSVMRHHTEYRDEWTRTDAGWKIRRRTLHHLFMDGPVHGPDRVVLYPAPEPW